MIWRGRKVLVTGGAGFLGSNLCHVLGRRGAEVTALDAMLPQMGANPANLEGSGARLVEIDLRSDDRLLRELCDGTEVLFNFAAQTSHAGSMHDPLLDLTINTTIQLHLIEAMRQVAPRAAVVHASTRQFYGRPQYLPVDERHPIVPPDANGVSKWAGEQYWLLEQRVRDRPVTSLRLTNCYGPRLRVKDARQTFLGIWIRRVLEGDPFEVWGGEQLRDLAYVDDVVEAFMLAGTCLLGGLDRPDAQGCNGRVFNIGGDAPMSLLALADLLIETAGAGRYDVREFPEDKRAIDIGSFHADDRAFRAATGWEPRVPLRDGLRRTLDWFRPRLTQYL
ncbi:NAD-dependent epimerase/dehydratase family protein [Roseomonas elaeocarpi]|uniref:NAD-dependent epimerase/dehydratase family protein n=1 Tax=Roseomonas elaeocarpi TaxID=907779 RepID=A0ABV6JWZ9_9PROT